MKEKTPPPPLADVIKYGIIILTAGIQIGLFYATRTTVEKHDVKIEKLEKESAVQRTDIEILSVRLKAIRGDK